MATRAGLIDGQRSTAYLTTIDFSDHDGRVLCRDFHETESTHLAGIEVSNKNYGFDSPVLTE
jgi:hypothetical protein